ncbi:Sulfate Permease (SulP) Family [Achlya hypogyna]|uniref:Sulfate Permease (SulP) Family n=1 Tax=Achlya hypogyna TaxID=1202772 RepID=A0A1V9ZQZ2_ACHHY|nr:Sulfate Permease (SulP) Family [Achlya hypogyna]
MSFADFAGSGAPLAASRNAPVVLPSKGHGVIEKVSAKLEQFQRQVTEVKRQAASVSTSLDVQQDLEDRIKYACLIQEEIAKLMPQLPRTSAAEMSRRKLLKDFDAISSQLEKAVTQVSAAQMAHVSHLEEAAEGTLQGSMHGQVIEFKQLDCEIAHNEALIEERAKDIDRIQQSVVQVNEIFRDLAVIVAEQQGAINDAHSHVEESLAQTQQGLAEVKKAAASQSSCALM